MSVKPVAAAAPADEDAPVDEDDAPAASEAARESEFEIWNGDPDEIVAASRKSWPPSEAKRVAGAARKKSWPSAELERAAGAPPGAPPRPAPSSASHGRLVAKKLAPGDAGNVARASVQNVAKTLSGGVRR